MTTLDSLSNSPLPAMDLMSPSSTPAAARKLSARSHNDEIIVWDDPPSSPFVSEVSEASRQASAGWKQETVDPEIEAIFEDAEGIDHRAQNEPVKGTAPVDDKENTAPPTESTVSKPSTPSKPSRDDTMTTALRDAFAMPPPSTTRRPNGSSPDKPSTTTHTPLHVRSEKVVPMSATRSFRREPAPSYDDFSMVQDETNIDDTCFSTFSAVPETTVFARMGEARSPAKSQQVVGPTHIVCRILC